jgi:hypothetical protein
MTPRMSPLLLRFPTKDRKEYFIKYVGLPLSRCEWVVLDRIENEFFEFDRRKDDTGQEVEHSINIFTPKDSLKEKDLLRKC